MALIAAATIAVGAYGAHEAGQAADAQASAARRAGGLTQRQFEQTRSDLSPYRTIGDQAVGQLSRAIGGDLSGFQASPGYNFRLAEGNQALDRSAAGRGMLLSGAQLKALSRYNQGQASNEFGNWFNRLYGLAGMGQNAAAQTGSFGANAAANQGNYLMAAGNAQAQGVQDRTNFITSGLQGLGTVWGGRSSGYKQPQNNQPVGSGGFGNLFNSVAENYYMGGA